MKANIIFILCLLLSHLAFAQIPEKQMTTLFTGIELIELGQNNFRNLGRDNHTFFLGASFGIDEKTSWGVHYTGMNVELSEEHLQEPSPAYKGDFTGVTGNLNVQRLYLDYYYNWDLNFLRIQPVVSFGLGYNNWQFHNRLVDEDYDLRTFSAGISGRFRFTFFEYIFAEIPALDIFLHLHKNRSPEAFLGDAHIAFNDWFGAFNWIFIGCSLPL